MADALKERENLYKLMISQLRYDGFEAIASTLAKVVNIISACPPMARLHQVVNLGLQAETEGVKPESTTIPGLTPPVETGRGIDLEYEPEGNDMNRERQTYSADESFMSNLELQKVAQESENEPEEMEDDLPSTSDVLHHIRRISSGKKTLRLIQHRNVTSPVKPATVIEDVPDTESIVDQVKIELVKYNVSQEVFAKAVLGKSQGYLSEMLKHGENMFSPSEQTHCRGWQNFETMRQFMSKPEAERLRIYFQKGEELKMERLKRRQMETGCPGDDPLKKKRRFIPTEAKAVMEECYSRNRYLTTEKRQMLAKSLAIPEQCVSDFFKNLRSRKKHEERMKYFLKDLEYSNQQRENVAFEGSNGFGGVSKSQVLSCSSQGRSDLLTSVTPTPCKSESLSQSSGEMDSLERHCAATSKAFTFTSQASLGNDIHKIDIVASKIAALSQSQQMQHKQPTHSNTKTSSLCKTSINGDPRMTTNTTTSHFAAQDASTPVSSSASVETFSFESLPVIDSSCSSVVLQGGTPGTEGLEVGQQIYVVHVNNTIDSSISD